MVSQPHRHRPSCQPHRKVRLTPAEARAARTLRPALDASVDALRRRVGQLVRTRRPGVALVEAIPWDALRAPVVEAWRPIASGIGGAAVREARVLKDVTDDEADAIGARWGRGAAGLLGDRVTETTRAGMLEILAQAQARGWDDATTTQAMVEWAGVTPTNAKTLAAQYDALVREGMGDDAINRALSTRARGMVRDRAELTAINEHNAAESGAYVSTWERMLGKGDIGAGSTMEWETFDPCPVCQAIADRGPIPVGEMFVSPLQGGRQLRHPPAHPRCRCRPRLIPVALKVLRIAGRVWLPGTPIDLPRRVA